MMNTDTDIEIVSINADKRFVPASTVKIMTCLVLLENVKDLGAKVTVPYECFDEFWEGDPNFYGASEAGIMPLQDNLTYKDCAYAMMLPSACEAANIIAYNVGKGSIDNFVAMMNKTAEKLGCKNTHFTNPHGLYEEDQYTSAYDLYLITRYAMDTYPTFMKICSTYEYDMPANENNPDGYTKVQTNRLMNVSSDYYCEGVKGVKTGSIDCWYNHKNGEWDMENPVPGTRALVTTAERNGYNYIIVTLGADYYDENGEDSDYNFADHIALYNWAFDEFEYSQVVKKNEQIMKVEVIKGQDDEVGIVTTDEYYTLMPKSLDASSIQRIKPVIEPFTAPVSRGKIVGSLQLKLNDETLVNIPLAIESDVGLDVGAEVTDRLVNFFTSPLFIGGIAAVVVLIIALIVIVNVNKRKKKKQREIMRRRKLQMAPQSGKKGKRK